jgi:NAD(P)-dependent dehydrogenase (short-subunit alcohol dehydrogenase family)
MANYLIIGGSSGIGKQLSDQMAQSGHTVYATYHEHQTESNVHNLEYHHCDVLEDTINLDYLPQSLDGLAYCPGSIKLRPFQRIKPEDFASDFELQFVGAAKVIQAALPKLKASGKGTIVMFSTVAVQAGFPFHAQVAASKGAIEGLTKSLAAELAPHIRVNCIAPSLTDTPMAAHLLSSDEKREANAQRHPLKRIGTAVDIANMAEYLLTEKSGWMTGQIIHVDGGMSVVKS